MTTRPLRVLTLGHSYVVGTNHAVPAALASTHGVEVTVAAPAYHHGDLRRVHLEQPEGAPHTVIPLPTKLSRWIHVFWYEHGALRRAVRGSPYDVVHMWEEPYIYAGYQIAKAVAPTKAAFLFRTEQNLVKRYPWPFSSFERRTLERADGWVAGGRIAYEAMIEKGWSSERGRMITLGVDTLRFRPISDTDRNAVRQELGLDPPVIGFIGRLVEAKGLPILMQALERVTAPWSLLLLGSGGLHERIESWADAKGFGDRVRIMLLNHDKMPRYVAAMDVLVAPSQSTPQWTEQFGRMSVEAFACRVPVIGSDSGEIPHVIGDAGRVVGEADIEGWWRAIQDLLENPTERAQLAQAGYERAQSTFAIDRIAEQYLELYEWMLTHRRS